MQKHRNRIYLSVDDVTFGRLSKFVKRNGYKNECELVSAMIHVMLDRLNKADERLYDLPSEDGEYIDSMFVEMANVTKQADGDGAVAVVHRVKGGGL